MACRPYLPLYHILRSAYCAILIGKIFLHRIKGIPSASYNVLNTLTVLHAGLWEGIRRARGTTQHRIFVEVPFPVDMGICRGLLTTSDVAILTMHPPCRSALLRTTEIGAPARKVRSNWHCIISKMSLVVGTVQQV